MIEQTDYKNFKAGFVGVIGKPNVGKSTLLNTIINQKITIVSPKPQTTRTQMRGIYNGEDVQIVFIDTPGITKPKDRFEELIVSAAYSSLDDVDAILFLVEATGVSNQDLEIAKKLASLKNQNIVTGITKVDLVKKREEILPVIDSISKILPDKEFLPLSSLKLVGIDTLIEKLRDLLPYSPPFYPKDRITDVWERILVAEIIREKIFLFTHQEIPYSTAVEVEEYKERNENLVYIKAKIYVERQGQKAILIGKGGEMLKKIGKAARIDISETIGKRVYLDLWIKVDRNWKEKKELLKRMGYIP